MAQVLGDEDVPGWWQALGLPGLVDIHVHLMPERVMQAVWRYFDEAQLHFGFDMPTTYRVSEDERVAVLDRLGVRAFTSLPIRTSPGWPSR